MSLLDDFVNGSQSKQAPNGLSSAPNSSGLPMFKIDQVTLPGSLDIVSAAVKNNILLIAVINRKLLRIDLGNPAEIQDFEIPRSKGNEIDEIQRIHLDDLGQHLVVSTTKGENWYLHTKLSKPVRMKAKGFVQCIAWNSMGTAFSTKEVLLGLAGGTVIETWLEPTEGFNKTVDRYSRQIYSLPSSEAITGLHFYVGRSLRERHALLATQDSLFHYRATIEASSGDSPALTSLFSGVPGQQKFRPSHARAPLAMVRDESAASGQHYAWLTSDGIFHGPAPNDVPGDSSFQDAGLIALETTDNLTDLKVQDLQLSLFHVLVIQDEHIRVHNHFDGSKVYYEQLATNDSVIALMADPKEQTYWLYTRTELYEIVITDEAQHMWEIKLKAKDYESALKYATTAMQMDAIYAVQAQSLMQKQEYSQAADIFGRTSLPLEEVALNFLDINERDALRIYLCKKLDGQKKSAEMQRTTIATWILELFMSRFSALDDLHNNLRDPVRSANDRKLVVSEYASFISKYKSDLDKDATYALINSHGRSDELILFANAINDYSYIVNYQIGQDNYSAALDLLVTHPNVELTYATSSILLPEIPHETVEMWMRMTHLDPVRLLPAILIYNDRKSIPIHENQALRFLHFTIKHQNNTETVIHNTLIGIYARDCAGEEGALLEFLEGQSSHPYYDLDFGLRQCKQYGRVMSCVYIYSSMGLYDQAVHWALEHDNIRLASTVADRVEENPALRKKLWLMIAKKTIEHEGGTKEAIEMTKRSDVLRIEDLVPHMGEFTVIDDFKDEICQALENYTTNIETLRHEMDESSRTAENIEKNIQDLKKRFVVVHVGEECYHCHRPLLEKQFYVFPCQHTFHGQCLMSAIQRDSAPHLRRHITQLQAQLRETNVLISRASTTTANGKSGDAHNQQSSIEVLQKQARKYTEELDLIVGEECLLCGQSMIRSIDRGFMPGDDKMEIAAAASWVL